MHNAEEVRKVAEWMGNDNVGSEMLLAYADLLEAMETAHFMSGPHADICDWLRKRAAEKQKARKG